MALVVKNTPASAGDIRSWGQQDPLSGGHGSLLQYSCLETPMDRGVWRATVPRVAESGVTGATSTLTVKLVGLKMHCFPAKGRKTFPFLTAFLSSDRVLLGSRSPIRLGFALIFALLFIINWYWHLFLKKPPHLSSNSSFTETTCYDLATVTSAQTFNVYPCHMKFTVGENVI